jgi:enoyl-CoA hydratase/carnithine racemase
VALVKYEKKQHLVTITLNRPEKLNAMNLDMLEALRNAWIQYGSDEGAWLALLTGEGRAFSAGADIDDIKSWAAHGRFFPGYYLETIAKDPYLAGKLDKPTMVAVNGLALGGGFDLVLRADLRLAAKSAIFGVPEVDLCGVLLFWDNLPYAITTEILVGGKISAERAYEIGIINRVVSDGQLLEHCLEWADELLAKPQPALRAALRAMKEMRTATAPFSRTLELEYARLLGFELSKPIEKS